LLVNRDNASAFKTLGEVQWKPEIAALATALAGQIRERALQTISQAYSSIAVSDVSSILGLGEQEAIKGERIRFKCVRNFVLIASSQLASSWDGKWIQHQTLSCRCRNQGLASVLQD
jgi:hypothetical protein